MKQIVAVSREILIFCGLFLFSCSKTPSLNTSSTLSDVDMQQDKVACEGIIKTECIQSQLTAQRACLAQLEKDLSACENKFKINYKSVIEGENNKMLENIRIKANVAQKDLEAVMAKEKLRAEKLLNSTRNYELILAKVSQKQKNIFGGSLKTFNDSANTTVAAFKEIITKVAGTDIENLITVKLSMHNLNNSLVIPATRLILEVDSIKNDWGSVKDFYNMLKTDYPDFLSNTETNGITLAEDATLDLEKIVTHVTGTRNQINDKIKDLSAQIDTRISKLIVMQADLATRKTIEDSRRADATAKFINRVNELTKPLYDTIPQFSNGFLNLEQRYKIVYKIIDSAEICGDQNSTQGNWKHAGCVLLQGEMETANRYLKESFPLFVLQEIKKIGKYDNGSMLLLAQAAKETFKAGKIAEALAAYSALVGRIGVD